MLTPFFDLLQISSTLLPTLLDALHTSLARHVHPTSDAPAHLTQSPSPLHSLATTSNSLALGVSELLDRSRPSDRSEQQRELDAEAERLEAVYEDLREAAWEKEMEGFLAGEDEESRSGCSEEDGESFVAELVGAGKEKDRLQEVEREVESLRAVSITSSHILNCRYVDTVADYRSGLDHIRRKPVCLRRFSRRPFSSKFHSPAT